MQKFIIVITKYDKIMQDITKFITKLTSSKDKKSDPTILNMVGEIL